MPDHFPPAESRVSLEESSSESISVAQITHTLKRYRDAIIVLLTIVMIVYFVVAVASYVLAPSQRVTSLSFRLDFDGATRGLYPNGLKFSSAEITATLVLLRVYQDNDLRRFTGFEKFARSLFVLESNREYERLAAEYQANLADSRLSPIDRERIQKEFEHKRDAISKNEYSLNYLRLERVKRIPEPMVRKVLADILNAWADYTVKDQDVLAYRIAVLSPTILSTDRFGEVGPDDGGSDAPVEVRSSPRQRRSAAEAPRRGAGPRRRWFGQMIHARLSKPRVPNATLKMSSAWREAGPMPAHRAAYDQRWGFGRLLRPGCHWKGERNQSED